jgi:hypothetical protein
MKQIPLTKGYGDGLNNQRWNLREATTSQNHANRKKTRGLSRYKGVYWQKIGEKWSAAVKYQGLKHYLGLFKDEADAATAYNLKAFELFGEFARFNVPVQELRPKQQWFLSSKAI